MSDNLFNSANPRLTPLAERCRPSSLEEYIGQEHLLDEGKIINSMIKKDYILSLVLWGAPGCGKTTLAKIIARESNMDAHFLSAISAGVSDVRKVIKKGKENKILGIKTLLFLDEIHRFNKAQQDAVLGAVESGDIILIGATTENPSFSIISPLLSRTRVLKLKSLSEEFLKSILVNALENDEILIKNNVEISDEIKEKLVKISTGDARRMLNLLELSVTISADGKITDEILREALKDISAYYDRDGDRHYDTISAFIKSMRGSDPDGALYYLARMIAGGEDPVFIARRMIIFASEDVGNASPQALNLAVSTLTAVQNIGMPESRIILSQCATYLASAPKSNSCYSAIGNALTVAENFNYEIPLHIRNAPTKMMAEMGYGKDYKYPHDYPGHFVKETYLPEEIKGRVFYHPSEEGAERVLKERLEALWPEKYGKEDKKK